MTNKRRCFVLALRLAPALLLAAPAGAAAAALKIGIFSETLPGGDATLPARLAESFRNGLGGEVALLENVRFEPGETSKVEE
ncbi:MAG: phosphoglycerate kinase, partial [Planctomycetes bacterium]|nr:phosphoglycerate kinase [Planctomycetota bacterium]